jgi:2-aminoadipate transaminase
MDKLKVAKQAADLHSNFLSQVIIHQYLEDNDLDEHIEKIRTQYHQQCQCMLSAIQQYFPKDVRCTQPEGGMFLWATLPARMSSLELFDKAISENVAFVPGSAFYVDGGGERSFRLNFSNSNEEKIETGIKKLSKAIKKMML